mgnify:CR=1 FL=1
MLAEGNTRQRHQQQVRGVVLSDKMMKTRVIEVKYGRPHRLYHKNMMRRTKIFVHDEKNESHVGDVVLASLSRPLSKNKHFRLVRILEKKVTQ